MLGQFGTRFLKNNQMVKQLQSNKSEILKMKNIADGVIKLKDLL